MTIFEFDLGDRAEAPVPSGGRRQGTIADRTVRDEALRPVPYVTVQVSSNVTLTVPQSEVSPP